MAGCFEEMLIFPQTMGTRIKKMRVYQPNSIWPLQPPFLDGIKIPRAGFLDHQQDIRSNHIETLLHALHSIQFSHHSPQVADALGENQQQEEEVVGAEEGLEIQGEQHQEEEDEEELGEPAIEE